MAKQSILVAVDLSPEAEQVLAKAVSLFPDADFHVTHIVEPVITDSNMMLPTDFHDVEKALSERAQAFLKELVGKVSTRKMTTSVEIGSVKGEIFRQVEERSAGVIVIGTHGRHGIGLLLGSTANAVLHGTPCDVYAVKIREA